MKPLQTRDALAIMFTTGYKMAGGEWWKSFLYGMGLRIAMDRFDWPPQSILLPAAVDPKSALDLLQERFFPEPTSEPVSDAGKIIDITERTS